MAGALLAACHGPETFTGSLDAAPTDTSGTGGAGSGSGGIGGDGTGGSGGGNQTGGAIATIDAPVMADAAPETSDVALPPDAPPVTDAPPDTNGFLPDPNLVAYWKFDEGTGNTLRDSSTKHNDALVTNTVAWAAGAANLPMLKFPDAAAVTLGGGYAVAGATGLPAINHTISISVWVNLKAATGADQYILCLCNGGAAQAVALGVHAGQLSAWAWGPRPLAGAAPPSINSWHHVAYTFDGANHLLYVDGLQAGSGNTAANSGPVTQVSIGAFGNGSLYSGMLDDLRIYTVALTASQIARLAGGDANPGAP